MYKDNFYVNIGTQKYHPAEFSMGKNYHSKFI